METTSHESSFVKLIVQFDPTLDHDIKNSIDQLMLQELGCDGIEDLSLSESELNDLLGKEAVTGGPLPLEVLNVLEDYTNKMENKSSTYYFYGENCHGLAEDAKQQLQQAFQAKGIMNIDLKVCQEESWLEKWKEHYHPIEISNDFIVLPSWHEPKNYAHSTQLRIDPGQAFGTGSHESTKLCLTLIHQYFSKNNPMNILDFGCGSGILALAHTKINEAAVTYLYDIDPAAYDNIEVNRKLNSIDAEKTILIPAGEELSSPWKDQKYNLVMANILLPILLDKAELLSSLVAVEGYLLISGIMVDQWDELYAVLSNYADWKIVDYKELNFWKAVLIKKIS
jgi:ribosomal protein L11 methyltransferase